MAETQNNRVAEHGLVSQVSFVNNSFGREDAILFANTNAQAGDLKDLPLKLKQHGITAYPDVRDGQHVLVAYGFKNPQALTRILNNEKVLSEQGNANIQVSNSKKTDSGFLKKFVKRYSIRLAAVSGLLGHASMAAISALTNDHKWFSTAWKYTAADAVIAKYGTDKNVTADPIMQDFKDYLWKQGMDNDFVKARTDKISAGESFDTFMKKYSFQIANAFGAMGNLNQVQIGLKDGNHGFVIAGATSMFGAGLQIFGSEQKRNPQQTERKGVLSKLFGFVDANPMQIAALTNFTDPFALFYGAARNKELTAQKKQMNQAEMLKNYAILGSSSLATQGLYSEQKAEDLAKVSSTADKLLEQYGRRENLLSSIMPNKKSFDAGEAARLEKELQQNAAALGGKDGLDKALNLDSTFGHKEGFTREKTSLLDSLPIPFRKKKVKEDHELTKASKSWERIEELREHNDILSRGSKWKTPLLFMVATFYTGATLLRLIARKTATGAENKDAFNEVFAAGAESLLNIHDEQKREATLLQMGHYLSNHPKMEVPADKIIEALRERVESFKNNAFVDSTSVAIAGDTKAVEEQPAPTKQVAENNAEKAEPPKNWVDRSNAKDFDSHQAAMDYTRKASEDIATGPAVS